MEELIKITTGNMSGAQCLSAKELYLFLGFDKSNWVSWAKNNIVDNVYCAEGIDWERLVLNTSVKNSYDYVITVDFAKRLCMMARSEKGEEARRYFIECENTVKQGLRYRLPVTYAEALRQLADETEAKEKIQKELESAKPKIDFFNQVADSKDAIDMGSVAKVLNYGMGRNKLFEFLRNEGILMSNNQPYQQYQDMGWFRVVEQKYTKPDSSTHISTKTLVYQKGLQAIQKRISKQAEKNLSSL